MPGWTSQVEAGIRAPGSLQVSRAGSDGHTRPPSSQLLLWAGPPALALLRGCCGCSVRPKDGPAVSQACGGQRWLRHRAGEGRHAGGEPASQGRHTPVGWEAGPLRPRSRGEFPVEGGLRLSAGPSEGAPSPLLSPSLGTRGRRQRGGRAVGASEPGGQEGCPLPK